MYSRFSSIMFTLLALAGTALPASSMAATYYGEHLLVAKDGDVIATLFSDTAVYTSDLYLAIPGNSLGIIFTNKTTPEWTQVNLGTHAAGTELIFSIAVHDTGNIFLSGPASMNPDGKAHTLMNDDLIPGQVYVGFEDLHFQEGYFFNYHDLDFSLTNVRVQAAPLPASAVLLGSGIAAIGAMARRKKAAR